MSLCCLVLYHPSVTTQTKSFIVKSIFPTEITEMEVLNATTLIAYLENVQREKIWQATANLESADVQTVYAFGKNREEVRRRALDLLE